MSGADLINRLMLGSTKGKEKIMAKVIFGNHSSVIVPRQDRDGIRKFYCDVLGGSITKEESDRDFLRLGQDFFIVFMYGDVPDASEFLRTARSVWLEIKSDNVEEMQQKVVDSGLVRKLNVPDPHLYFQAPGGQCLRLVGITEDLSFYEGAGEGPNVERIKEALNQMETQNYMATIEVAKSPNDVFRDLADVSKWWGGQDYEGRSAQLNDEFTVKHGDAHYSKQKLVEVVPDKKIVWLVTESTLNWLEKDKNEWTNTKMVFELAPRGNKTVLHFTHEGLVPEKECYSRCERGWNMVIKEWLFNFIRDGKPQVPGLTERAESAH